MESVRYAAALDTGEGFMAFAGGYLITPTPHLEVGEIELPEGRILPDGYAVWPWHKLRRMTPTDGEYIYRVEGILVREDSLMVTDLGDGTCLVGTDRPMPLYLWGGKVTEYAWDRAAYIEVAMA